MMKKLLSQNSVLLIAAAMACATSAQVAAAELVVNVSGISTANGQIGCALFKGGEGFPMDNTRAEQQWWPASTNGVTCRFKGLSDGSYAASASHDLNGNRKVDTNFVGMPTEAWGVSNNPRPTLRAPRFDEAEFKISGGKDLTIDIRVDK